MKLRRYANLLAQQYFIGAWKILQGSLQRGFATLLRPFSSLLFGMLPKQEASMGQQVKRRRQRQRTMLHWAQRGICAGCGGAIKATGKDRRAPDYPTFDHVDPRRLGGPRSIKNGLLKHRRCNELREGRLPSGCDLIWHWSVLEKLQSDAAIARWGEALAPVFYPGWRPPVEHGPTFGGQA